MAEAAAVVWVRGPGVGCRAVRDVSAACSVQDLIHRHCQDQGVPAECFFVKCDGSLADSRDTVRHGAVYSLEPRLHGGKGGFGSMLRALGAQIEKTTNREACRDLSGRRLRDVNHEKAMAEWVKQQAEREAEKEQRRLERLQRKLAEPRHCFTNPDYQQQCHEMAERLEDSVLKGMQASSSKMVSAEMGEPRKRPSKPEADGGSSAPKRKCFWLGVEGLETAEGSGSDSSDDDSDEAPGTSVTSSPAPNRDSAGAESAGECPRSPPRAGVLGADCHSPEALPSPEAGSGDRRAQRGDTAARERGEGKGAAETETAQEEEEEEAQRRAPAEAAAAGPGPKRETETEVTDGARAARAAPAEDGEGIPSTKPGDSQAGSSALGQESVDLLAFSSVAEMESLGLEKLKRELMARGLKCGGTLQERAARLFSVRGLAPALIDPALLARPPRGRKK
ncbi:replication stress response regulator SDE2 isoform X2 [Pipistrellus kuhlii]|uniref:replication stress response regulator SDE2 isoform X2 n=1 Tax=Pipistrellus kuhlii TaxID=59472 RepID=UPI00174EE78C|nr:replication stress response regulator SDE2 isoform X2 [Pipistrellus kuhlii]